MLCALAVAGLLVLPLSTSFRDCMGSVVSGDPYVSSIPVFAGIVGFSALTMFSVALAIGLMTR